jgi:hypothetical protein
MNGPRRVSYRPDWRRNSGYLLRKKVSHAILPNTEMGLTDMDWQDPNFTTILAQDEPPPTPGEVLPYDFDPYDDTTTRNVSQVNGLKIEEALRQRVLQCKHQERSQAQTKWGPFHVQLNASGDKLEITNSKGKKALTLKQTEYQLNTGEYEFNTQDLSMYMLLCYTGPKLIVSQVKQARLGGLSRKVETGTFCLSRDADNLKLINISDKEGTLYSFGLSKTSRPPDENWTPLGQQGSTLLQRNVK